MITVLCIFSFMIAVWFSTVVFGRLLYRKSINSITFMIWSASVAYLFYYFVLRNLQ
jgi:hypothetical protein